MEVVYNDVTHQVVSGDYALPDQLCNTPERLIYSHVDGASEFRVLAQQGDPYAYVAVFPVVQPEVTIDSIATTNATNEATADGVVNISATGNGILEYRVFGSGGSYGISPVIGGLLPGSYTANVRVTLTSGLTKTVSQNFIIGQDEVVCNLTLGTVNSTPEVDSGNDGTITVQTLNNAVKEVEYRLGAGAWQDSPVFTGLAAATYSVQVRYKDQTACTNARNVTVAADISVVCDAQITDYDVLHERSKFADDGYVKIYATSSNTPITYNKDGGAFGSGSEFTGLAPGSYVFGIKDAENCIDNITVEVRKYRVPVIEFPLAIPHRIVLSDTALQNFDNTLFKDFKIPGITPCEWFIPVSTSELQTIQFRTNYQDYHKLRIRRYSDDAIVGTIDFTQKTDLTDIAEALNAYVANYTLSASQKQVFFNTGLPIWAEVGQTITLSGFATGGLNTSFDIVDIVPGTGDADGFESIIITYSGSISTQLGTVSTIYDIEPYDVYEAVVNWAQYAAARYYLEVELRDVQFTTSKSYSEPIELKASHADSLVIKWRNFDNKFKLDYTTGLENLMRLKAVLKLATPGGERSTMEDSKNSLIKLDEDVTRQVELRVYDIPPYMAEKLKVIFAHDYVTVNGVRYTADEDLEMETFANDALVNASIILRQYDFDAINSDDSGGIDSPVNILGLNNDLFEVNPA